MQVAVTSGHDNKCNLSIDTHVVSTTSTLLVFARLELLPDGYIDTITPHHPRLIAVRRPLRCLRLVEFSNRRPVGIP